MVQPRPFNTDRDHVPAIVVNTNDPESRGRVQCQRLDQQNIPTDQLPWIFIHNAEHFPQVFEKSGKSVGASTHVLIPGAWVNIPKEIVDNQTGISKGAIATDGSSGSQ